MLEFSARPAALVESTTKNLNLIIALVVRDVTSRYRGSAIGMFWSLINPLLMLSVYTFVFSVVFQARWGEGTGSKTEFALVLFAGMIVFNLFAECINQAPRLILDNPNYVKKVVFPIEVLAWVPLGAALFQCGISCLVWVCAYLLLFGIPHLTILYVPFVIVPFVFFLLGATWFLSALGVYVRDVAQFIGILTTVMLFLSPIFYPASALPESLRAYIYINPLTSIIEEFRKVMFWGVKPDFGLLFGYLLASMCCAFVGFAWFQKTRKGFADVL